MREDIVLILCYPDTEVKMDMVRDLISKVTSAGYPILLTSHMPLPLDIISQVEYYIYDRNDTLSENYVIYYHFYNEDFHIKTKRSEPYHALAGYISQKSSATFLRNKFKRLHYLQYDTIMRIPEYIEMAAGLLKSYDFVGAEYKVPSQGLHYIVGTFFSTNIKWYDNNLPEISSWDEYKSCASGEGDKLLAEGWLYRLFESRVMIPCCYFLSPEESSKYLIQDKIQTRGGKEDGLITRISELDDHRLIIFCHPYNKGQLNFTITHNGEVFPVFLAPGTSYWRVMEKSGTINIDSAEQHYKFDIDPDKEYTETVFKFNDDRLRCLKNYEG